MLAAIAMGVACTEDAVSMFAPGSGGSSVGVFESFDGGATITYDAGVGETAESLILMAGAVKDSDTVKGDATVLVGGLFGSALSTDAGATWNKVDANPIVTQVIPR